MLLLAVINAWVQSREPGCALRAEQVLIKMLQHYRNGNKDVKPNVVSFSTVINGWAKCSSEEAGAAKRAEKIFNLMLEEYKGGNEDAKPNSISYCSLIDACVKSRDRGSLERAEDIYNGIYQNYVGENDDMKPSTVLANQIMDAWSKSGQDCGGEKSEGMLNRLITLYKEYGDAEFKPNDRSFTIVINAYAKSRRFRKAKKAREILDQMISAYKDGNSAAKPNVFSFTAVINACAFTVGDDLEKNEAMQIAIAAYKLLGVYDSPNHVTYSCFLKACLNLIPKGPSQESALITVFKKCREHGQVTDMILKLLLRTLTPQQVEKIVGVNGTISIENIPDDWKFKGNSAKKQVRP
jgi:pentatricopeptide repeat protein